MNSQQLNKETEFGYIDEKYCDYNSTSPLPTSLLDYVRTAYEEFWHNGSTTYGASENSRSLLRRVHNSLESLSRDKAFRSIVCSTATEANNLAIHSVVHSLASEDLVLCSPVEHASVRGTIAAKSARVQVEALGLLPSGVIDLSHLKGLVASGRRPSAVICQLANNETGVVQPIRELREAVGTTCCLIVDGSQAVGKLEAWREDLELCDYFTISPHKFYGPKGVGVLLAKRGRPLHPLLVGGGQEKSIRPGTENTPVLYLTLGWIQLLPQLERAYEGISQIRDQFETSLLSRFPEANILGAQAKRLPNTSAVFIPGVDGDALVASMDNQGWAISTGSACHSGALEPSHVFLAYGLAWSEARETIRLSFGLGNPSELGAKLAESLGHAITQIRKLSGKIGLPVELSRQAQDGNDEERVI